MKNCSTSENRIKSSLRCTHKSSVAVSSYKYFKESDGEGAVFYRSCEACGAPVGETFTEPLFSRELYAPTSPTVTLYETEEGLSYGFAWNCSAKPTSPAVALKRVNEADFTYHAATLYMVGDGVYYCRATAELEPDAEYQYKLMDYASGAESEVFAFKACNPQSTEFRFAFLADSQNSAEDGKYLARIFDTMKDADFLIHGGDICENTAEEHNFVNMLDSNRAHLAVLPTMPISGNHDTTYKCGVHTLSKHFNNRIPEQSSTQKGYYYSFVYGGVKFIMLNTNVRDHWWGDPLPDGQYDWLVGELKANTCRMTIVVMHCPMYSPGGYGAQTAGGKNSASLVIRAQLNDLFCASGVDLVIQAHDHLFSKTYPIGMGCEVKHCSQSTVDGVVYDLDPTGPVYIMTGPAGNQCRGLTSGYPSELYERAENGKEASWAEFSVSQNRIQVTVKSVDEEGKTDTYHTFGIIKG